MTHTYKLPPLENLPAFEVAARLGSFTAAAEELGLTHSTVSRRVQSIENWLGMSLFERQPRGVSLTPAGHRFLLTVTEAFGLVGRFAQQWRPGRKLQTVRVSVVPSFARLWLFPRILNLQGQPPDLRVEILPEHRLADLGRRDADVAVRYGSGDYRGCTSWPLFSEELQPVAVPSLVEKPPPSLTPEAISHLPLIHDSDTILWKQWFSGTNAPFRVKSDDRRFEDYDMVLHAAKAGLGVALARRPLADDFIARSPLVPLSERRIDNARSHYVVIANGENRAHVLALVERLRGLTRNAPAE